MIISEKKQDIRLFQSPDNPQDKSIKPNKILIDYFTDFALEDAKDDLWELLKAAMGDRTGSQEEVSHFFFVYERLSDLIVAAYLVTKKKYLKEKRKQGKRTATHLKGDR